MHSLTRFFREMLARLGFALVRITPEERRYVHETADDSVPIPRDAAEYLRPDNPRLLSLQRAYKGLDWPCCTASSWWNSAKLRERLSLANFRAESPFLRHYRELPRVTRLKYLAFSMYTQQIDELGLRDQLGEDGAFGCWTFKFQEYGTVSRDLLDSINEISFLNRHLKIVQNPQLRILDIGAGYGRLAHRMSQAVPTIRDYCCMDAIPESTFLCEYYLKYRGLNGNFRALPLPEITGLKPGDFDLAINVHSFSECTAAAITWWMEQIQRLGIPRLFIIPNEPHEFLTREIDNSRKDFLGILEGNGFRITVEEPVFANADVRELLKVHDRFYLFERT